MALKSYSIENNKYICKNQWNNYYVFNVKGALDYDVMLDIYTVDLEEFTRKYDSSSDENKVAMDVQKIESAINNKDYVFVYNKLDETFKNTNFESYENFEKYMSENFFDINNLKGENISKEGNIYVYKVKITDANNENNTKDSTIIMKLLEDRNFVMSFSI